MPMLLLLLLQQQQQQLPTLCCTQCLRQVRVRAVSAVVQAHVRQVWHVHVV
jgi:hypothetical protein